MCGVRTLVSAPVPSRQICHSGRRNCGHALEHTSHLMLVEPILTAASIPRPCVLSFDHSPRLNCKPRERDVGAGLCCGSSFCALSMCIALIASSFLLNSTQLSIRVQPYRTHAVSNRFLSAELGQPKRVSVSFWRKTCPCHEIVFALGHQFGHSSAMTPPSTLPITTAWNFEQVHDV